MVEHIPHKDDCPGSSPGSTTKNERYIMTKNKLLRSIKSLNFIKTEFGEKICFIKISLNETSYDNSFDSYKGLISELKSTLNMKVVILNSETDINIYY